MASQKVEVIQNELKKVIGPIGKFVVEKQINKIAKYTTVFYGSSQDGVGDDFPCTISYKPPELRLH